MLYYLNTNNKLLLLSLCFLCSISIPFFEVLVKYIRINGIMVHFVIRYAFVFRPANTGFLKKVIIFVIKVF